MNVVASPSLRTVAIGTVTDSQGNVTPVKVETIGVDRVRHDLGEGDFTSVSNAGDGFLSKKGGKYNLPSWVTKYVRAEHLPALSLMSDYINPNLQVRYLGLEDVNGKPAHHIRVSMLPTDNTPSNIEDLISEFHVYLDKVSLLVVKTKTFEFSPDSLRNRSPINTLFSDYRLQNGALVPFHLIRYVVNQKASETTFTSISLTANVPESDFR